MDTSLLVNIVFSCKIGKLFSYWHFTCTDLCVLHIIGSRTFPASDNSLPNSWDQLPYHDHKNATDETQTYEKRMRFRSFLVGMELPLLIGAGAAVVAILLVVVLVFLKGGGNGQSKDDEDEHEQRSSVKKEGLQTEKKKERKIDRSRKASHSSHPLLAVELKGHTRAIVGVDFDINGKYVITASEGE